jgi:hypothetical protein
MTLRSPHEIHEADVNAIQELIAGCGSDDGAERERLLWQLVGIHAGSLTPVSENEKRGMERVLAILERKPNRAFDPGQGHAARRKLATVECPFEPM